MGYSGNTEPNYIIPTIISTSTPGIGGKVKDCDDLDFFIGYDALSMSKKNYNINYPIKHGIVSDWDNMEKYINGCIYRCLRADPERHFCLLTEPPLNTPENREYTAEIMFETFNVPGLYIGVQAVMALIASQLSSKEKKPLSGTVIDSGDGVTHIIPVIEGYVIGSCIKHIPLAGSDITKFVLQNIRDRGENFPADDALSVARGIKEEFSYVCPDVVKEFEKYDADPSKFKVYEGVNSKNKQKYHVDVGYESFLGPEVFFNPEIYSSEFTTPLPDVVDNCIQKCPIDTRRSLYKNIVLSGGSTMFKDFGRRIQRDVSRITKGRQKLFQTKGGMKLTEVEVKVVSHSMQRYAVWFGGSMLASLPQFKEFCHLKSDYEEIGPAVARHNVVFKSF